MVIVGVVEDFHVNSLNSKIEPLVLYYTPDISRFLSIRIESGQVYQVLDRVEEEWKKVTEEIPFDYFFLDDRFDNIHRSERELGRLFIYFTFLAIFIACLGLFGLSSYVIQRRIKEIGIRKVLGSSLGSIVLLLSMDFNKWVLLANVVAWPLAYLLMENWLQNFAYRTRISLGIFILSGLIALIISSGTVMFQTIKAANKNPVDTLKYE
jgi:putative ABC transport system permease protein